MDYDEPSVQKTVALGLRYLAQKVEDGKYGINDAAFGGDEDKLAQAFLDDMHDDVLSKME